jgi:hypothetical protein
VHREQVADRHVALQNGRFTLSPLTPTTTATTTQQQQQQQHGHPADGNILQFNHQVHGQLTAAPQIPDFSNGIKFAYYTLTSIRIFINIRMYIYNQLRQVVSDAADDVN